ncbi:MAG: hypothetical protein M3436_19690 [Pseudomonadota bacterium]|nr:hypothetical protein [Pseudomonadota bacterium]
MNPRASTIWLAAVTLVLKSHQLARARFVRLWSYDELTKTADCIMIVSVSEPSQRIGGKLFWAPIYSGSNQVRRAFCSEGHVRRQVWDLDHLEYPKNTSVIINAYGFISFA